MDTRFHPHNTHLQVPDQFARSDPQLRRLACQPLVPPRLLSDLPSRAPGIYTIGGVLALGCGLFAP